MFAFFFQNFHAVKKKKKKNALILFEYIASEKPKNCRYLAVYLRLTTSDVRIPGVVLKAGENGFILIFLCNNDPTVSKAAPWGVQ